MSNFEQEAKHPETGEIQAAQWLDDYFGRHRYGVLFPDGSVFPENEIETIEVNGVEADCTEDLTTVRHWDQAAKYTGSSAQ